MRKTNHEAVSNDWLYRSPLSRSAIHTDGEAPPDTSRPVREATGARDVRATERAGPAIHLLPPATHQSTFRDNTYRLLNKTG